MSENIEKAEILTEQFWERPASKTQGSPSFAIVYQAVGFATTNWEFVENDLSELFCAFTSRKRPIRRAYGTIFGNSGRRDAVRAAAEAYFRKYWDDKQVRSSITNLLHAVGLAAKRRDEIVHGAVSAWSIVKQGGEMIEYGSFLMPPEYNTRYTATEHAVNDIGFFSTANYRYTGEDITELGHKFRKLADFVRAYRADVTTGKDGFIPLIERLIEDGQITRK